MRTPIDWNAPRWRQCLLPLVQTFEEERYHALVCIPDRTTAECELTALRRQHGPRLLRATIAKDRTRHAGTRPTYTLRYRVLETEERAIF